MAFKIVRNDITRMNTRAIVNTASAEVTVGPGCDSAIYNAAGLDKLLSYRREKIGAAFEGEAFITPGFDLKAKYIIHAVSPLYTGGDEGEEEKLRSCYRNSLKLAKEHDINSISFPLISTGSFGYPKEEGIRIAADEINAFLLDNDMDVFLVVFDDKANELGKRIFPDLEEYIDNKYVETRRRDALFGSFHRAPGRAAAACAKMEMADSAIAPEEALENKLEERIRHTSDTFSQYLLYLIKEKGMENADVYKRAIVDKKIFSKIKNNPDYHPQKLTALCLCIGAMLNIDQTKDLLSRAGYALSPCDKTDIIFSYFIENGIYDMIELDIQLEEHGLPCIIT